METGWDEDRFTGRDLDVDLATLDFDLVGDGLDLGVEYFLELKSRVSGFVGESSDRSNSMLWSETVSFACELPSGMVSEAAAAVVESTGCATMFPWVCVCDTSLAMAM